MMDASSSVRLCDVLDSSMVISVKRKENLTPSGDNGNAHTA